jgi:hypothetical protein
VADVLYIWLFGILGVNAFVSILALAHAMQQPDPFRKLAACCSTAVSITLLLAGSLLSILVPRERHARLLISYQCCSTRAQGRTLRPLSGKPLPKISDPRRVVSRPGPLSFRRWHPTRALV